MPCDTYLSKGQTLAERKEEVKRVVTLYDQLLAKGRAKVKIGSQGAVTFTGLEVEAVDRRFVTDACIYRRIMSTGSTLARLAVAKAERLAGRVVDRRVVAQGVHSHDGGETWGSDR